MGLEDQFLVIFEKFILYLLSPCCAVAYPNLLPSLKSITASWLQVIIPVKEKCFLLGAHLLYKGWYASNTPVWQNLVRCVKSLKIFLLKTILWRASNASELGDIPPFVFTCCLVRDGWTHFVNLLLPVHSCLFWMWNRALIHFLLEVPDHLHTWQMPTRNDSQLTWSTFL